MATELREIDTAEDGSYICSPDLEISGTSTSSTEVLESLVSVSDGYTRKDSILTIKLSESIIGTDDVYSVPRNTLYEFIDSNGTTKFFDITTLTEDSGQTIITVYGRTKELTEFFGTLEAKTLTGYTVIFGIDLKVSQLNTCPKPKKINFFNISTNGISATLYGVDFNFVSKWRLRYRKTGVDVWNQIESENNQIHLLSLSSGTTYEADALVFCTEDDFSDYSDINYFITL